MLRWITLCLVAGCGEPATTFTQCNHRQWSDWCNAHCPQYAATGGACTVEGAYCDYGESVVACQGGAWVCTEGNCCPCGGGVGQACSTCGDLTAPPYGCHALIDCENSCALDDHACVDACSLGATPHAQDLIAALYDCGHGACFAMNDADSGLPYCTDATMDSQECLDCYGRSIDPGGACIAQWNACRADMP